MTQVADQLRAAAGEGVPLIGLTYPDVLLGAYVYPVGPPTAASVSLAELSVTAFKSFINPTLEAAYAAGQGTFVDVTAKTGAYTPLTTTVNFPKFGTIPAATASVCTLTWFCQRQHLRADGRLHRHRQDDRRRVPEGRRLSRSVD